MIRLFCGYDEREASGFHVFASSVIRRCLEPVQIVALQDLQRDGSNRFTYARYRVPELCHFQGWAIFADACDMVCLGEMSELWRLRDERYAVQVVKHSYSTRHRIKYIGTDMECPNLDYPRKNWSSLMLINCEAPEWRQDWPDGIAAHQFPHFRDERIGDLPAAWNVLVDEGQDAGGAKILHYTAGIPGFAHYRDAPMSWAWREEYRTMSAPHV